MSFCVIIINFLVLLALCTCMCSYSSSALLSSHVVSVATEWYWSERLSGMGSKYKFLIIRVKLISYYHDATLINMTFILK